MSPAERIWVVIPAAGVGARMQADRPKQYLQLLGRTVLEHTLRRFLQHPRIDGVMLALAADDPYWPTLGLSDQKLELATGGQERSDSVLSALDSLSAHARPQDWVLVHDAARPCVRSSDIDVMLEQLVNDPVGGILALPVRDTMKRADDGGRISETVERDGLWHALTPQMFRFEKLRQALQQARASGLAVTDEAMAIEARGLQPKLLAGHADNLKITHPQDLALAELYLKQQEQQACE